MRALPSRLLPVCLLAAFLLAGCASPPSPGTSTTDKPASFTAQSADVPTDVNAGADSDDGDDAVQLTYARGSTSIPLSDLRLGVDETMLDAAAASGRWGSCTTGVFCSSVTLSRVAWQPGESLYVWKGTTSTVENLQNVHRLRVLVRGETVLDTTVTVHDDGSATQNGSFVLPSYTVEPVDLPSGLQGAPSGDADAAPDAVRITMTGGPDAIRQAHITLAVDHTPLAGQTQGASGFSDDARAFCTNLPGNATMDGGFDWARGASLYLWAASGGDCAKAGNLQGAHRFVVEGLHETEYDATLQVPDDLRS